MYTLKSLAQRGSLLGAASALVVAAVLPGAIAFADSLNPLTNRSLLLSSAAPGYVNTDGSGNSETQLNAHGEEYAPPGSGPNGMKTGETFSFNVSTDSVAAGKPIKAFTLQYCTTAAGDCQAPGNNSGDKRTSDRKTNAAALADKTSDLDVVTDGTTPWAEGAGAGQYQVFVNGVATSGWVMSTKNVEDTSYNNPQGSSALTGKNNFIVLTNSTGVNPTANQNVKIVFNASSKNFITNPGAGAFFVKINTYKDDNTSTTALLPDTSANIIDGGVTVANVMNDSIQITTKVLETMKFSVGTINPDTTHNQHGSCDAITTASANTLQLGNPSAEHSLSTEQAYDTNSYWRLSSNSSGGAVVYYSGDTLRNTVGNHIASMETEAHSQPGTEQFGIALNDAGADTMDTQNTFPGNWHTPNIAPLNIASDYAGGNVSSISDTTAANNAQFTFKVASQTSPVVLAQENTGVLDCATAKMRYVANIAANTPSGIYTTKINYLAAPQY